MKSQNLVRAANAFAAFILLMYPMRVVLGKALLFFRSYADACVQYKIDESRARACTTWSDVASAIPSQCVRAQQDLNRWPFVRAFESTVDGIHSCGDYSCSDLLLYIMSSWSMLLIVLAAVVTLAWSVSRRHAALLDSLEERSMRWRYRAPASQPARAHPSVMEVEIDRDAFSIDGGRRAALPASVAMPFSNLLNNSNSKRSLKPAVRFNADDE